MGARDDTAANCNTGQAEKNSVATPRLKGPPVVVAVVAARDGEWLDAEKGSNRTYDVFEGKAPHVAAQSEMNQTDKIQLISLAKAVP